MKILIVKYLPRKHLSHSGELLAHCQSLIPSNFTVSELDLLKTPPPYFDESNINIYISRDYLNTKLSLEEEKSIEVFDKLSAQFKSADIIIMAFPMYNFSFPGLVKTYFDAVMLKNKTWTIHKTGYQGLMNGKKAITLSASGGAYLYPPNLWDHLTSLAKAELQFLGFDEVVTILAENMNAGEILRQQSINRCLQEIDTVFSRWFNKSLK